MSFSQRQPPSFWVRFGNQVPPIVIALWVVFQVLRYGLSVIYPAYTYDMQVASPDGLYDAVVLRGNLGAFDSFSFRMYVFPHELTPHLLRGQQILMTGLWRDTRYVAYWGYALPEFRWTGSSAFAMTQVERMEIDLNECGVMEFHPDLHVEAGKVKRVNISLVFDKKDEHNSHPYGARCFGEKLGSTVRNGERTQIMARRIPTGASKMVARTIPSNRPCRGQTATPSQGSSRSLPAG